MRMKPVVLIVGGEAATYQELRAQFHVNPYEMLHARSAGEALGLLGGRRVDVLVAHGAGADDPVPAGLDALAEEVVRRAPFARCVLLVTDAAGDGQGGEPGDGCGSAVVPRMEANLLLWPRPARAHDLLATLEDWLVDLSVSQAACEQESPPVITLHGEDASADVDGLMDQLRSVFERRPAAD
jgi:hypothetical protein